jgi:hypothetical protein
MEARDRELDFAGEVRFPVPGNQSTTEFTKLLVETIFELKLSVQRANASGGAARLNFFKYHTNDGRSVPCITGLKNSFSLNWRLPVVGSREGFSLEATIWSGGPPSLDYVAFEKPRPETSRDLHLGYSIANGYVWMGGDGADEFSAPALAGELMAWYLDNGR